MRGAIAGRAENSARCSRVDRASHRVGTEKTAAIPAVTVRALRGQQTLAIPGVDNNIVLVDAFLFSAAFESYSGGRKQDEMYSARSLQV